MTGSQYERELKKLLEARGWDVVRSAGSLGEGDLVALSPRQHDHTFAPYWLIEVKKTSNERPSFSTGPRKRAKEQWNKMCDHAYNGHNVCYCVRRTSGEYDKRGWHCWKVQAAWREQYPCLAYSDAAQLDNLFGERVEGEINPTIETFYWDD